VFKGVSKESLVTRNISWLEPKAGAPSPVSFFSRCLLSFFLHRSQIVSDELIIDQCPQNSSQKRPDDWHPEPIVRGAKYLGAPSANPGKQPGTEVSRRIDCVATIEPKRHPDQDYQQPNHNRSQSLTGSGVLRVRDRQNDKNQEGCSHNLVNQPA